jgi:hypothetical protein
MLGVAWISMLVQISHRPRTSPAHTLQAPHISRTHTASSAHLADAAQVLHSRTHRRCQPATISVIHDNQSQHATADTAAAITDDAATDKCAKPSHHISPLLPECSSPKHIKQTESRIFSNASQAFRRCLVVVPDSLRAFHRCLAGSFQACCRPFA